MDYNSLSKSDAPATQPEESYGDQNQVPAEDPYLYEERKQDYKHSGPGIASFVISLIAVIGYVISFVVVGAMAPSLVNEDNRLLAESSQAIMFLGMAVMGLAALNVIGVVVGIIGLSLRKRRKVFGIIGTIVNGAIILLFMLLVATFLVNAGSF